MNNSYKNVQENPDSIGDELNENKHSSLGMKLHTKVWRECYSPVQSMQINVYRIIRRVEERDLPAMLSPPEMHYLMRDGKVMQAGSIRVEVLTP